MAKLTPEEQKLRDDLFDELDMLEERLEFPCPHIYVDFIGVHSSMQHKGRGRKLLEAVCDYAASQRLPVMLFTNTQENIEFYKSLGFKILSSVSPKKYDFSNTYMLKD